MTVDSEGCLWIAFWDGWCLRRYSPDGEWLESVKLPGRAARPVARSAAATRPAVHHIREA